MKRPLLALSVLAAALTASLLPALAGGGSGSDSEPPPNTTITAGPIGPTNTTSATFMFTADQPDAHFSCALDGDKFENCEPPVTYNGLVDGQHTFFVYAVHDGRGAPASWSWLVDTVAPAPVGRVHANVGYGKLVISWRRSAEADHVVIFRGVGGSAGATQVYAGTGTRYVERRFAHALQHRYAFVSYDKAGNVSPTAGVNVEPSALLLAPQDGASVRRAHPPALRWRAIKRASFYNIQLWRGKQKVLSTWPKRTSLRLSRAWTYNNRHLQLKPGAYAWYVWPAFGKNGSYGKLAGTASFTVR